MTSGNTRCIGSDMALNARPTRDRPRSAIPTIEAEARSCRARPRALRRQRYFLGFEVTPWES
jgi:hypothetical protein